MIKKESLLEYINRLNNRIKRKERIAFLMLNNDKQAIDALGFNLRKPEMTRSQRELIADNSYQRDLLYKRLKKHYNDEDIGTIMSQLTLDNIVYINKVWSRFIKNHSLVNRTPQEL